MRRSQTYRPPYIITHRSKKETSHNYPMNIDARSDTGRWWHTFIEPWNGISIIRQITLSQPDHDLWTDASGAWGAGALWKSNWFQIKWSESLQEEQIAAKELAPILIASALWGDQWHGTVVRANCDNEAVVAVVNSGYSRDPFIRHLLRCLFFFVATYDFTLTAVHIPDCCNILADAISRNNISLFLSSYPQANPRPAEVPTEFINKLLIEKPDWTSNTWNHWFNSTFAPR